MNAITLRRARCCAVLLLLLLCPLFGCARQPRFTDAEAAVTYLSSEALDGRRPGDPGNELAQAYLAASLKQMDYAPFDKDYRHRYSEAIVQLDRAVLTLGTQTYAYPDALQPEQLSALSAELALPLTDDLDAQRDCILLLPPDGVLTEPVNPLIQAVIQTRDDTRAPILSDANLKAPTRLFVSRATYDALHAQLGQTAQLSFSAQQTDCARANVVGVRRAGDTPAKEAVVLSAHFDHLGRAPFSGKLFRGALDNASGCAALLSAAQTLSRSGGAENAYRDLYIAFFNTEEIMLQTGGGSLAFSEALSPQYRRVYQINLDCLGETGTEVLRLIPSGGESRALCRDMMRAASAAGFSCEWADGISDHISFPLGFSLTTGFDGVHRLDEPATLLDFDALQRAADLAASYADDLLGRPTIDLAQYAETAELTSVPLETPLALNECCVVDYGGKLVHVRERGITGDPQALFAQYVPGLSSFSDLFRLFALNLAMAGQEIGSVPFEPWQSCPTGLRAEEHEVGKVYASPVVLAELETVCGVLTPDGQLDFSFNFWPCSLAVPERLAQLERLTPAEPLGESHGWSYGWAEAPTESVRQLCLQQRTADGAYGYCATFCYMATPGQAQPPEDEVLNVLLSTPRVFDLLDALALACTP